MRCFLALAALLFASSQALADVRVLTSIKPLQLIAAAEGKRRGSYGGAVGYFTAHGDLDTCIVIRSAYVQEGIATVQAGAGIVLDSVP